MLRLWRKMQRFFFFVWLGFMQMCVCKTGVSALICFYVIRKSYMRAVPNLMYFGYFIDFPHSYDC